MSIDYSAPEQHCYENWHKGPFEDIDLDETPIRQRCIECGAIYPHPRKFKMPDGTIIYK